jgi:serine/threonine-protein kinase
MEDVLLNPGQLVCDGRYEILETLGRGGMGVVYKARSVSLKREVAIKMLTHIDEDLMRRLTSEAQLLAKIHHPAVLEIYDFVKEGSLGPMLVLEYVPGQDLSTLFGTPMAIDEAVDLMLAICSGVAACHRYAIIHRDIKPSNIRILDGTDWRKRVKILDFGIAIPHDSPIRRAQMARITRVGTVPGTPNFTAPELLRGEVPDERCDQYGLAILLYMAVTGREPFPDLKGQELIRTVLQGGWVAARLFRPDIPAGLERVLTRALDKDPRNRFDTVIDFACALLPFATPKGNELWTYYFTRAKRPVAKELLEAVSAANSAQPAVPLVKRIEPLDWPAARGPAPSPRPQAVAPTVVDAMPKRPRSPAAPPASKQEPDKIERRHLLRGRRLMDGAPPDAPLAGRTLWAFVAGAVVGATVCMVVVFIGLLFMQRHHDGNGQPEPVLAPASAPAPK